MTLFSGLVARAFTYRDNKVLTEGRAIVTNHNWSNGANDIVDFQSQASQGRLEAVAAVYVDNSQCSSPVFINVADPAATIRVPAGAQGVYPVFAHGLQQITVASAGGASTGTTEIIWTDTDRGLNVWQTGYNQTSQQVAVSNPIAVGSLPSGAGGNVGPGNGLITKLQQAGSDLSDTNPLPTKLAIAGADIANSNPVPVSVVAGGGGVASTVTISNTVGGATVTATNPFPTQLSAGNALVTATNPLPVQLSFGSAVVTANNPLATQDQLIDLWVPNAATGNYNVGEGLPTQVGFSGGGVAANNPLPVTINGSTLVFGTALKVLIGTGSGTITASNPLYTVISSNNLANAVNNPLQVQLGNGTSVISYTNPLPIVRQEAGSTPYFANVSATSGTLVNIKGSAGIIDYITLANSYTGGTCGISLSDSAGTGGTIVFEVGAPTNDVIHLAFPRGIQFNTGIEIALVNQGTGTNGQFFVNLGYR